MGLPDPALKFGAYTLVCHQLAAHLSELHTATQLDRRLSCDQCCDRFDEALHHLFERAPVADVPEAVSRLCDLLSAQANLFRRNSPAPAAIFDRMIAAMIADAPGWDYAVDVQRAHDLGRDLACRFYANSPYAVTQGRYTQEYPLEFAYGEPGEEEDWPTVSALPLGYRAAPVAFRPRSGNIIVRFSFDSDLALYLAYPFMFLHEYTAHIYGTDFGNDRFNDG